MTEAELLRMFSTMLLIRRFEERTTEVHWLRTDPARAGIFGLLHTCDGQEATAVGGNFPLRSDDYMTCTYRGHGHLIAKGVEPRAIMAELFGKKAGINEGKAGSMMMSDPTKGALGENAVVGAAIPIAVGAAMSAKLRGTGQIAITFFGDGAMNQGYFHEAANLASVWQAPIVFFLENNLYSESTPIRSMVNIERLCDRAAAYGIPAVQIDGNDVLLVHETTRAAVERARSGGGPTLIEALTYRLVTHWIGREGDKRPKDEVERWRQRDPIVLFEARLADDFGIARERLAEVRAEVEREVEAIVAFAEQTPVPPPEDASKGVFG